MSAAEKLPDPAEADGHLENVRADPRALKAQAKLRFFSSLGWLVEHGLASFWPPPVPNEPAPPSRPLGNPTMKYVAAEREKNRPGPTLHTTCADTIKAEPVSWLWPGRIARTRITIFMGMPDQGKSTLMTWVATMITTGGQWPDCGDRAERGTVLYLQVEESRSEDIANRLETFGADRSKLEYLDGIDLGDGRVRRISLPRDSIPGGAIEMALDRFGDVRALIVDPLGAFLGETNTRSTEEVYDALIPLKDLAERRQFAVIIVAHPNKAGEQNVIHKLANSQAFGAIARALWYVTYDPNDATRRMISFAKGNPKGLVKKPLAFSIGQGDRLAFDTDAGDMGAQVVDFILQNNLREEAMKAKRRGPRPGSSAEAGPLILEALCDGPKLRSALKNRVVSPEISESSFWKSLKDLKTAKKVVIKPMLPGSKKAYVWLAEDFEEGDACLPLSDGPDIPPETARIRDSGPIPLEDKDIYARGFEGKPRAS